MTRETIAAALQATVDLVSKLVDEIDRLEKVDPQLRAVLDRAEEVARFNARFQPHRLADLLQAVDGLAIALHGYGVDIPLRSGPR